MLAQGMQGEKRDQLIAMAATWEKLAQDRADLIRRHPDQALAGEREEETKQRQVTSRASAPPSLGVLAAIVLIRTFLSFSLEVEIEGRWPWQRRSAG